MSEYAALAGRVRQALADLEHVVRRAEELMRKAQQTGDDGYLDGVALNLHGFYAGAERIFEDIARETDEGLPSSPTWHQSLLLQMSGEIPDLRPSVISQETRHCLDDYRGFRHVVRNVYAFNLSSARLRELTSGLRACFDATVHDLGIFAEFLLAVDDRDGGEQA